MTNEASCTCKPLTYDDLVEGKRPGQWECAIHGYLATRHAAHKAEAVSRAQRAYESQRKVHDD